MKVPKFRKTVALVIVTITAASLVITPSAAQCQVLTLHVAPNGDDRWSGRLAQPNDVRSDGPLASLVGARDAVRQIKERGPLTETIHIQIADGTYHLTEAVVFKPTDSGTADHPIVYQAAPRARPVFSGGRRIMGFKRAGSGLWTANLPDVKSGKWYFEQLFVNGRRATRARSPNKFYHYIEGHANYETDPNTGEPIRSDRRAFVARLGDVNPLADLSHDLLNDVTAVVYHSWAIGRHRVAAFDAITRTVFFTSESRWPLLHWGS